MPKEQAGSIADEVKMKPGHKKQFINGLELIDSAAAQMKALQLAAVEAATPADVDGAVGAAAAGVSAGTGTTITLVESIATEEVSSAPRDQGGARGVELNGSQAGRPQA